MKTDLQSSIDSLVQRHTLGVKLGLEQMKLLMAALGNPQDELACIHVAGTNGKGSVCAMIESILRRSGFRTGFYSSPHLHRFNERFRIDGVSIEDGLLEAALREVEAADAAVAETPEGRPSTFFEFATACAFVAFRNAGVRLVVLETGLGGRLDATNIVTPLISVITPIAMDHMQYLGDTLELIAAEKAAILKPGRPAVLAPQDPVALDVITATARQQSCSLRNAAEAVDMRVLNRALDGQRVAFTTQAGLQGRALLPLLGPHQVDNAAVAIAACECIADAIGIDLESEAVSDGLAQVQWRARAEVMCREPLVLLDSGHNPAGGAALRGLIRELLDDVPRGYVVGMCGDKQTAEFLREAGVGEGTRFCRTVAIPNPRSIPAAELAGQARMLGAPAEPAELAVALRDAFAWARENDGAILIAGSVFLAGQVLEMESRGDLPWSK